MFFLSLGCGLRVHGFGTFRLPGNVWVSEVGKASEKAPNQTTMSATEFLSSD